MDNPSVQGNTANTDAYLVMLGTQGLTIQNLEVLSPGFSTLSPAEQKEVINLLAAQSPTLQPPVVMMMSGRDFANLAVDWETTKSKIISDMLDKWNESVHEEAKKSEDYYNSPAYKSKIESLTANGISAQDNHNRDTKVQFTTGTEPSISVGSPNEERRLRLPNAQDAEDMEVNPLVVGTALSATGTYSLLMINTTPLVGVDPMQDSWNKIAQPLIPDNNAAVLSQIGALMAAKLIDFANIESITKAAGGEPVNDGQTAKNFAANVLAVIDDPKFTTFLQNLVVSTLDKGAQADPKSPEVSRQVAVFKIALMMRALAALNFVATSNHSGEEVLKMIGGQIALPEGDIGKLILQIRVQLTALPPGDQALILGNMAAYIDTKPNIKDLTNSGSVFRNALPPNPIEEDLIGEEKG